MADKTTTKAAAKQGNALDLPMTLLAAGSVAFAAFAMPADLFGSLVSASGLPALLPAAQPPLGGTARLAFVAGSALATFALVWAVLRALGKPAKKLAETVEEAPRRRRADMHPDAPARAPIRAGSDLGVPLGSIEVEEREPAADLSEVENVDFEAEWERPAPSFLQPAVDADETDKVETSSEELVIEPVSPESEVPFWVPEDGADERKADEPEDRAESDVVAFWPIDAAPEQAPPAGAQEPPLDNLVSRLEGGLIRRKRDGSRRRPADDRLRSALDDLTRASRRS